MTDAPLIRDIWCCACAVKVPARLTDGEEVYPHRRDLYDLPFWRCDTCGNHVGCHHKTKHRITPLGCIPSPAIRNARKHIHALMDPLWKNGLIDRREMYRQISVRMGTARGRYHTANIRTIEEARKAYRVILEIEQELNEERLIE